MQRRPSQESVDSPARIEMRPSLLGCDGWEWSCAGPRSSQRWPTSSSHVVRGRREHPSAGQFDDAYDDDGSPPSHVKAGQNDSRLPASSASSFAPSPTRPRNEIRQRRPNDFFSLDDLLPSPLQGLMESYVPREDNFYRPLTILPYEEYQVGSLLGLKVDFSEDSECLTYDAISLLQSLRHCKLYLPPPIPAYEVEGIPIRHLSSLRQWPIEHLNNLQVLFVTFDVNSRIFPEMIQQLGDLLKNIKLLFIQRLSTRFKDEWFVFDMSHSEDRVSAITDAIVAINEAMYTNDFAKFMQTYANDKGNDIVLVEAAIRIRKSTLPAFMSSCDRPVGNIHWSFDLGEPGEFDPVVPFKSERLLNKITFEAVPPLENYPKLRDLAYYGADLSSGFHHWLLSSFFWNVRGPVSGDVSLEGLVNLQCLEVTDELCWFGPKRLFLGENHRLWRLVLIGFSSSVIDMGDMSCHLDFVYIERFCATLLLTDALSVRELEIHECNDGELLKQLGQLAEKSFFSLTRLDDKTKKSRSELRRMGPMTKHPETFLSKIKNLRLNWQACAEDMEESFYALQLAGRFDYLTHLEADGSCLILDPKRLPKLRILKLSDCKVVFVEHLHDAAHHANDAQNYFECLEVLEMNSCEGALRAKEPILGENEYIGANYFLRAPVLQRLTIRYTSEMQRLWLDDVTYPMLRSFEWSGYEYSELPFLINSEQVPRFSMLNELRLRRECKTIEKSHMLADILCLSTVSTLALTAFTVIDNFSQMDLSCQFAQFSSFVLSSTAQRVTAEDSFKGHDFPTLDSHFELPKMRNIELLIVDKIVIQSLPNKESRQLRAQENTRRLSQATAANAPETKEDD